MIQSSTERDLDAGEMMRSERKTVDSRERYEIRTWLGIFGKVQVRLQSSY